MNTFYYYPTCITIINKRGHNLTVRNILSPSSTFSEETGTLPHLLQL